MVHQTTVRTSTITASRHPFTTVAVLEFGLVTVLTTLVVPPLVEEVTVEVTAEVAVEEVLELEVVEDVVGKKLYDVS